MPTAPAFIEGIIVLRNEVIPIIDLRERLYPQLERVEQPLVLITHTSAGVIGLKVDEVRRIVNVAAGRLPPAAAARARHSRRAADRASCRSAKRSIC